MFSCESEDGNREPVVDEQHLGSAGAASEGMRLRMVAAAVGNLAEAELLPFALQQAVAELGGLGGMAHVREGDRLRLAATSGLPLNAAGGWRHLRLDNPAGPPAAFRGQRTVWLPLAPSHPALQPSFPQGAGVIAVPLPGPRHPMGTLTVLTARPRPPSPSEQEFLSKLAAVTGERLRYHDADDVPLTRRRNSSSRSRLRGVIREINLGIWDWDLHTDRIIADDAALEAMGLNRDSYDERAESWSSMVHPDDASAAHTVVERAVADSGSYVSEYRVRHPDGSTAWIETHGHVVPGPDSRPARVTGTVWDTTRTRTARDATERALRHMPDGFLAMDDHWRVVYGNAEAERLFDGSNRLIGRELWDLAPGIAAVRDQCRSAVADGDRTGFDIRAPANENWYRMRLVPGPTGLTAYFTDVTEKLAQEAQQVRAAKESEQSAALIGELTEGLAQALTVQDVVAAMAAHLLPLFGASGLVTAAIDGRRLRVVGSFGYEKEFTDLFDALDVDAMSPAAEVLRDRAPLFVSSVREYVRRYPHLADLRARGGKQAWAFLPLIASGRPVGYCVLSFDAPRALKDQERTLLVALAGLIAHAFERARLYDAEHSRAQELQRGLLPRTLPELPAVTAAARYIPAGPGAEVGGDWYDVIPLSSERVALVIGDVMGHGVSEAVTMGRLRAAVRTLADLDVPPDELLTRLDSLINTLGGTSSATCLYAVYDPTNCTLAFASAGHPPPAILPPDGSAYFPPLDPNPPLGLVQPPLTTVELILPPESLVAMYTDGLVESPATDIDAGMAGLGSSLTAAAARSPAGRAQDLRDVRGDAEQLEALCQDVTAALLPHQGPHHDDAAVLVVRTHALDRQNMASWSLPENPVAAGQARELVRAQLAAWDLEELSMTTELLVSELIGNVIRHANGPIHLRLLRGRTLICEVSDGSLTTPRIRHASDNDEGGRGLQLVAALSYRWGARFTATGKYIWTEQRRPGTPVPA
jgi:PAS domain S-box-containing protein